MNRLLGKVLHDDEVRLKANIAEDVERLVAARDKLKQSGKPKRES